MKTERNTPFKGVQIHKTKFKQLKIIYKISPRRNLEGPGDKGEGSFFVCPPPGVWFR